METKRVLVIEKLIFNIPDDYVSESGRDEVTIDEALELYLKHRKSQKAALENQFGNFSYFFSNMPANMIPDVPASMVTPNLLEYLNEKALQCSAGMGATLIYDKELGGYRNCYTEDEMDVFQQKKEFIQMLRESEKASSEDNRCHCDGCNEICSERCPDEPGVEEAMVNDEE